MKVKIHKGDSVEVMTGPEKDKGKRGEVISVQPDDQTVVVQGVHIITKHQRQVQSQGRTINPGIVKREGSIAISKVMLVCPRCNKPTRVGLRREGDKVHRICKKCSGEIDS